MTHLKHQSARPWGTVAPDKGYDIGHVDVRFDVPLGMSYEAMQLHGYPEIKKAIEQFERIGGWRFYDKLQPTYHVSTVHSASLAEANILLQNPKNIFQTNKSGAQAVGDLLGTDTITMIARVYFIRPLVWVNDDETKEYKEQFITYENGFVPLEDMPAEYKEARNDLSNDD